MTSSAYFNPWSDQKTWFIPAVMSTIQYIKNQSSELLSALSSNYKLIIREKIR